MRIEVPGEISHTLWEGLLEPPADADPRALRTVEPDAAIQARMPDTSELPTTSIGLPEVWRLDELYPSYEIPAHIQSRLEKADFYFVQLSCSFRPRSGRTRIEWARFVISLIGDKPDTPPVVSDLHPVEVRQEVQRHVRVGFSPTLKFQSLSVGIGEAAFEFQYPELQPIVSGAGVGETTADWSYSEARGVTLQGSKFMHMLVRAPRGTRSCSANLDLMADVIYQGRRIPVLRQRREEDKKAGPLTATLWG